MAELTLADVSLYYEVHQPAVAGQLANQTQLPLLLIAGLASDSQSWQPVLNSLCQQRQVILLDNRGSGRTRAQAGTSLKQMAEDCIGLCNHLQLEKFDVLGHSMGGFVALHLARMVPNRVHHLVLANSSAAQSARNEMMFADWADALEEHGATDHWWRTFFYWILTRRFFDNQEGLEQLVALAQRYPYAPDAMSFRSQVLAMVGFDARPWLKDIHQRALVLAASEDLLFPPGTHGAGLADLPQSTLTVVPGLAHSLPLEAPKVFNEAVLKFLDG
jgi:pimeloyl-ACP methyl ester carboxylesterase